MTYPALSIFLASTAGTVTGILLLIAAAAAFVAFGRKMGWDKY